MPGSNPLFGLNTLGGALSLQTKDGRGRNHTEVSFTGGSFGRKIQIWKPAAPPRRG